MKKCFIILFLFTLVHINAQEKFDRAFLTKFVDTYFDGLINNNPSSLPLSENVKITFNGDIVPASKLFWNNAQKVIFRFDIANTRFGDTGTEAVIKNEDGSLTMYLLRLKIKDNKIIEIETIKCNKGEADGIWGADNLTDVSQAYKLSIREVERDSYYDLIGTADSYWRAFQTNGSPLYRPARLLADSRRYENGMQTTGFFKDGKFESTAAGFDVGYFSERNIWDRRFPVVDEERGVVLSIVRFGIKAGSKSKSDATTHDRLVAEFFAIKSGWIQEIQAVIVNRPDELSTGWISEYGPDRAIKK